jgi:hypothetical protein
MMTTDPDPATIATACAAIRESWTDGLQRAPDGPHDRRMGGPGIREIDVRRVLYGRRVLRKRLDQKSRD